ncbi:HAD-IC family P-type ATPase [Pengzhenrongella frigida]|uniref:HAD-IC family P-type ATPase n=1 Tax=Pengzhenrongella frigida TaxID=1259133 RepID=UPI0013EC6322|nr:HAD-IC family P-type ATPase [Cellulomonas sp. HLT2-17]
MLAAIVGDVKDVVVICVVVAFNAVLGFAQEYRAEASLAALEQMLVTQARVRSDGSISVVDAEDLVPGDVVLVDAGDRVPADGRWLVTVDLQIDESAFTGESMPVAKDVLPIPEGVVAVADRFCMVSMAVRKSPQVASRKSPLVAR